MTPDKPPPVRLTDAGSLRALAHPLRIALLDALLVHGPLTATQAAEVVGESPSNCSFHLRQLAKYGVVEAAEGPDRRSRPWQVPVGGLEIAGDVTDPASAAAGQALDEAMAARAYRALVDWARRLPHEPKEWRDASDSLTSVQWMTADEAAELARELREVVSRYDARKRDPRSRPAGARPVQLFVHGFPVDPPPVDPAPADPADPAAGDDAS